MKLALVINKEDDPYLSYVKPLLAGHNVTVIQRAIGTLAELYSSYEGIITTRLDVLERLTIGKGKNISDYSGSLFTRGEKPFLVIDPLRDLIATPPGQFLAKRYFKKITHPKDWFPQSKFEWTLCDEFNLDSIYTLLSSADYIAIDIETTRGEPYVIRCVGYCGVWLRDDGSYVTRCYVIPFTTLDFVKWVRKINDLPNVKIFQNGIFDNLYFFRFGCPVRNWLLDTLEMFHCWYSELPKSLDYITLFLLRDVWYWKDDADSGDLHDLYEYNARDAWATANSMLALLSEIPQWGLENYKIKYPLVFPCLAANFEGLRYDLALVNQDPKTDEEREKSLYIKQAKIVEDNLKSLKAKIGNENFNPNSSPQVTRLIQVLTGPISARNPTQFAYNNSDKKVLAKVAKKHPLNNFIIDEVLKARAARKLVSTYLGAELWGDRLLYTHRPSGTDTGRLSCTKSLFSGKGAQIQNQPPYNKQVIIADEGFYLGEADNKQSEAYGLGYISGDENLIETLNSGKDFHSVNIERFFGISYEEVWDIVNNKTKNKPLRDLSKRVNHGTAYVMEEDVLLETMGLENVVKAQLLLDLPKNWKPTQVTRFLLDQYHIAYPKVKADFYEWVKAYIKQNGKLVSALGWTRYCFGRPWDNKRHFKAYVAHVPQNLSVGIINRGFIKIFNELQLPNWQNFRIKAQIHDSILFQYRIGRIDLAFKAREILTQQIPVTDVKGKNRVMQIPVDLKGEHTHWSELKSLH